MAILPFAKVAAVAIKQVSKPLSKAVSDAAKNSRILSGGVEWLGQSLHRANVWTNRRSLGLGKAANAPPPLEQVDQSQLTLLLTPGCHLSGCRQHVR
jgi:hypothetical protein